MYAGVPMTAPICVASPAGEVQSVAVKPPGGSAASGVSAVDTSGPAAPAGSGGGAAPTNLARPQSTSSVSPKRPSRTLDGLTSRCRTPWLWA